MILYRIAWRLKNNLSYSDRTQGESLDGMIMPSGNSLDKVNQMYINLEKFYGMQRNYIEKLRTAFMDVQNKGSNNQNVRDFSGLRKGPKGTSQAILVGLNSL